MVFVYSHIAIVLKRKSRAVEPIEVRILCKLFLGGPLVLFLQRPYFPKLTMVLLDLKGCSQGAIVSVIYFVQLMDCIEFMVIVTILPCEH